MIFEFHFIYLCDLGETLIEVHPEVDGDWAIDRQVIGLVTGSLSAFLGWAAARLSLRVLLLFVFSGFTLCDALAGQSKTVFI